MPDQIYVLLEEYRKAVMKILGKSFNKIILYGSYARGDYQIDSDIDIMILADVKPEEVNDYADKIYDVTYDFEMEYELEINPLVQSMQTYSQWKNIYPFFRNIEKDGVLV